MPPVLFWQKCLEQKKQRYNSQFLTAALDKFTLLAATTDPFGCYSEVIDWPEFNAASLP